MRRTPVVVVDNGASTIKVGLSNDARNVRLVPNAIIRSKGDKTTYFGHEFAACRDFSSLHYRLPFEKGYLVDWDAEKAIWDGIFDEKFLGVDPTAASLLITEPYFNLPNIQDVYDQFVFEEYDFQAYRRCTPASLIPHGQLFSKPGQPRPACTVVVDSGFSFTHVVPIIDGAIAWHAVKRIDVGGKLLTNQLKELVSFRQWNMMDETHIMNDVKETCCFVTSRFGADLEACRANPKCNPILQEYVLPDFSLNARGRVRGAGEPAVNGEQILYMGNERFSVPELLFRPDDIGLAQSGLAATISQSIALLPPDLQGMFWANIGLVGGNANIPGLAARLLSELRSLAPVECEVVIYESKDPILEPYYSAAAFAKQAAFPKATVTRAEYLESGSNATRRKFRDWRSADAELETWADAGKGKAKAKSKGKGKTGASSDSDSASPPSSPPQKAVRTRTRTVSAVKRR